MATQPNKQARVLTESDIKKALAVVEIDLQHKAMFLLSVRSGLRAKEIAGLTWGAIDFEKGLLRLTETKGGKFREVPVSADTLATLKGLRETSRNPHCFENRQSKPGKQLTAANVANWFHDLYNRKLKWSGYSSHSGRRTAITKWARGVSRCGGSLRDVQALAGHSDLTTTSRYIETSPDAQRKLVEL